MNKLGFLSATWGIFGIFLLLGTALYRLTPIAMETFDYQLGWHHYFILTINIVFMAYSEGYKGFQKKFSPRVAARAKYLMQNPEWRFLPVAPLFCVGYIYALRKTKIVTRLLTLFIIIIIISLKYVPQPWRGIVDIGVVVGLSWGTISLVVFLFQAFFSENFSHSPEMPLQESSKTNK